MAENKLFYNVSESNAKAFKDIKKDEKVLGLVHSGLDGDFGYFISQGKQFGASKTEINSMISSSINNFASTLDDTYATDADLGTVAGQVDTVAGQVDTVAGQVDTIVASSAAFAVGSEKFKILFDEDSRISVVKYTSISGFKHTLTASTGAFTTTKSGDGTFYVGTTYSGSVKIEPSSTFDTHKISIYLSCTNPTSETFTYKFSSTNALVSGALKGCLEGETSGTTTGTAYVFAKDVFNNTTKEIQCSGTVAWSTYSTTVAATKKDNAALQITYFAQEKASDFLASPSPYSKTVDFITAPSITFTVKPKVRIGFLETGIEDEKIFTLNEYFEKHRDEIIAYFDQDKDGILNEAEYQNYSDAYTSQITSVNLTSTTVKEENETRYISWATDQSTSTINSTIICSIPANKILTVFVPEVFPANVSVHENNVAETELKGFFGSSETYSLNVDGCRTTYKVYKANTAGGNRSVKVKIKK